MCGSTCCSGTAIIAALLGRCVVLLDLPGDHNARTHSPLHPTAFFALHLLCVLLA
jgi:hypothetical protein